MLGKQGQTKHTADRVTTKTCALAGMTFPYKYLLLTPSPQRSAFPAFFFFFLMFMYLFGCITSHLKHTESFTCDMGTLQLPHVKSSSPTRDRIQAPCVGSS